LIDGEIKEGHAKEVCQEIKCCFYLHKVEEKGRESMQQMRWSAENAPILNLYINRELERGI
jgi:hypothetical protein